MLRVNSSHFPSDTEVSQKRCGEVIKMRDLDAEDLKPSTAGYLLCSLGQVT